MNNFIKGAFVFATGAAIGSVVTWRILKNKYERLTQEEIDSVKEYYSGRQSEPISDDTESNRHNLLIDEEDVTEESDVSEYKDMIEESGYYDSSDIYDDGPQVISPDEFGEEDDYECIGLVYYTDGVLADDEDSVIKNIDEIVGSDSLTHLGEYEDDSVHVRNDRLKCYYEILLVHRKYSDILKKKPYLSED